MISDPILANNSKPKSNLDLLGKPKSGKKYKFEECISAIDTEILKRKKKWILKRISWLDYDDVSQIIRTHIFNKWEQWDQSKSLLPWVNRVITNQTKNVVRNVWTSHAKPCVSCSANAGGDLCWVYGTQCDGCPIFEKWAKSKKRAHDINMAESLDEMTDHTKSLLTVGHYFREENVDILHQHVIPLLTPIQRKVYTYLYIENRSEEETAELMNYKTNESKRKSGYKSFEKFKKVFIRVARQAIKQMGM